MNSSVGVGAHFRLALVAMLIFGSFFERMIMTELISSLSVCVINPI